MLRTIFIIFFLITSGNAHAEIYQNIGPLDTLGDLKSKFPNATFTKLNPAWAQETDVLFKISGPGISGGIIVYLSDGRPTFEKILKENPLAENAETLKQLIAKNDNDAIYVESVRWIPDYIVPLNRFISKYGKYDKSGFSDENFEPYHKWESKGVTTWLTSDEKNVNMVDFHFTKEETNNAYLQKYGFIPPWLKD